MSDVPVSLAEFYKDLRVLQNAAFPKKCGKCGKTYASLDDFLANTAPIRRTSGLIDVAGGARERVGLFRNCACHSTLLVQCRDRRSESRRGRRRREVFGRLLKRLEDGGVATPVARQELLKIMIGQRSRILEQAGFKPASKKMPA